MPRLEDFQKGIPLTPELAQLKAGFDKDPEVKDSEQVYETDDPDRPLDDGERYDLRRLLLEPGWRVLERLRLRALRQQEQTAILLSQNDPLRNADKIAAGWAYLIMFKQLRDLDLKMIDSEVGLLKRKRAEEGNGDAVHRSRD